MNDKNDACVCKCKNKCECSPEESEACEEEMMKILESRRVSISADATSLENQASKNEAQERQYEAPFTKPESNSCAPQESQAINKETKNAKRICNSNVTKSCMESQEKEPNKPQELKSTRTSSIKLLSKKSSSVNSLTAVNSDYSRDEWDRFGLFIASECKSMSKDKAKSFKKKCLELIVEYQ